MLSMLANLRPLMSTADIAVTLGLKEAEITSKLLQKFDYDDGVMIYRIHPENIIDQIVFTSKFPERISICGLSMGMSASMMFGVMPSLSLPAGATGEPNGQGWISYTATIAPEGFEITAGLRNGELRRIGLTRPHYQEVLAERQRREDDRIEDLKLAQERANRWKSIDDPGGMLESWAAHCSPLGKPPDKFVAYAKWLRTSSTPDQRHVAADLWNWDYSHAPLLWMIRQTDCDKATALSIFFKGEPFFYLQFAADRSAVPGHAVEVFDLLTEIRLRFAKGFYTRSEIAFDGEREMSGVHRSGASPMSIQAFYPPEAGQRFSGRDFSYQNNFGGLRLPDFGII